MPINIIIRKELPIYLATVPGPVVYIFFETIFLDYLTLCLLGRIIITEQSYPNDVLPKSFLAHLLHTIYSEQEDIPRRSKASLKLRFNFFSIQIGNLIYRLGWPDVYRDDRSVMQNLLWLTGNWKIEVPPYSVCQSCVMRIHVSLYLCIGPK